MPTKNRMTLTLIVLVLSSTALLAQKSGTLTPVIDGDWWQITGNPELGELTDPKQQPVDFGVWQAADGTWQLWSCIRATKEPGKTRLFYGWEGKSITAKDWTPKGIKMQGDPLVGETAGGMQAPYTWKEGNVWHMFYGDWNAISSAISKDGKVFVKIIQQNTEKVTAMFTEGAGTNTRDAMVIKEGDTYYCYYTAGMGFTDEGDHQSAVAVYCRSSKDLKHWSGSKIVAKGTGDGWFDHECPFVTKMGDYFYLFRTQRYGKENRSTVHVSKDPLNFGMGTDKGYFVTQLPVAAMELVNDKDQWYIVALNPELNGIRAAKLKWQK